MKKLAELVTIAANNETCVVLQVFPGTTPLDLIALGCFTGEETMIRVTKRNPMAVTLFRHIDHGKIYGNFQITKEDNKERPSRTDAILFQVVSECLEDDFGIPLSGTCEEILAGCSIRSASDHVGQSVEYRIGETAAGTYLRKNDRYLRTYPDFETAVAFVKNNLSSLIEEVQTTSGNSRILNIKGIAK